MASTQLAWSASTAVSPLFYSALLDRGALAAWGGPIAVCALWFALVEVLARRMPQVARPVTNVAEPEPGLGPPVSPDGPVGAPSDAPTTPA